LLRIPKKIIRKNTDSASANVVLTSAVGTIRQCGAKVCVNFAITSTGRKSIEFSANTSTNVDSASGATSVEARDRWTWPAVHEVDEELDHRLRLPGTPDVAARVTSQRKPKVIAPTTSVVITVSQCTVQKRPLPRRAARSG